MSIFFYSKKFFTLLILFWAVFLVAALLWLQGLIFTGLGQRIPVETRYARPSGNGPYSYIVPINTADLCQTEVSNSPAILLEDEQVMGPGNAPHTQIGTLGGGRFTYRAYALYFSSSDQSDPRINGRTYILVLPRPAAPSWLAWILLLALFPLAWLFWNYAQNLNLQIQSLLVPAAFGLAAASFYLFAIFQNDTLGILARIAILIHLWILFSIPAYWLMWLLKRFPKIRDNIYLHSLILILVFLVTRFSFFYYYPIVGLEGDTGSYVTRAFLDSPPLFDMRPPGYILFVGLITSFSDHWMTVIEIQSLLSLTSAICLIHGVYSLRPSLSLPATLAVSGFLASPHVLRYETSALSESLYTTCLILSFAFLLMGFGRRQARFFGMSSLFMGIVIAVRHAGIYMLVVYLVILLYLVWNKHERKVIFGFSAPLFVLLFLWGGYNYFTVGFFGISANTGLNMGSATVWFWEPDSSLPPEVNDVLRQLPASLSKIGINDQEQKLLKESWNAEQLFPLFKKICVPLVATGWTRGRFANTVSGKSAEAIVNQVIITSIKKHPELYLKFIWVNLVHFYKAVEWRVDFYDFMSERANLFYVKDDLYHSPYLNGEVSKEYYAKDALDFAVRTRSGEDTLITLRETRIQKLYLPLQYLQWILFHQFFWSIAFFIVFGASVIKLLAARGKHLGAFILFSLTITVIGASLVTCLSEPALERYAYPTQFIYYLSVALLPLLWLKDDAA